MKPFFFVFSLYIFVHINSVKAQELSMFSSVIGWEYYQDDIKIERDYFKKLLSDVPAAEESWKKVNLNLGIAVGMVGVEVGFGVWLIDNNQKNKSLTVPAIGLAASALSAIVLSVRSLTHRKHAILNYNRSFDKKYQKYIGQRLTPTSSGLGIAWAF